MDITELTEHEKLIQTMALTALNSCLRLIVQYKDEEGSRVVEVHAIGISRAGNHCMRVFQVSGYTNDMETSGWKMITHADVKMAWVMSEQSDAPEPGYKMNDKGMVRVLFQINVEQ